jgi:hypothetical protein
LNLLEVAIVMTIEPEMLLAAFFREGNHFNFPDIYVARLDDELREIVGVSGRIHSRAPSSVSIQTGSSIHCGSMP